MAEQCSKCGDSGLQLMVNKDGNRVARPCICKQLRRVDRQIKSAQLPDRFQHCSFETFQTDFPDADASLSAALLQARNFVNTYPLETDGKGLLFVGRPGLGKTHLAVATLRKLMEERGAHGLFVDYRDLLKQVQHSYNPSASSTELEILRPVFETEFLVIDDLGASKTSDWVFDTVAHILNSRYNRQLSTIMTTNFPNLPETSYEDWARLTVEQRSIRPSTLGDQIGDRVLSRLHEMCVIVEVTGMDVRKTYKRAQFSNTPQGGKFQKVAIFLDSKKDFPDSQNIDRPELRKPPSSNHFLADVEEVVGRKRLGRFAARNQPQ